MLTIYTIGKSTYRRILRAWRLRWPHHLRHSRRNTRRSHYPGALESAQFATPNRSHYRQLPCQRSHTGLMTSTTFCSSFASRCSDEGHRVRHSRRTPRHCSSPAAVSASLSASEALWTRITKINKQQILIKYDEWTLIRHTKWCRYRFPNSKWVCSHKYFA